MTKITLGISNRHLHLTESDYRQLFGDQPLTKRNDLSQPGQFAAQQTVTLFTDKNTLENVRLIGPFRAYTQVEISQTDARHLGITPPVRDSGDLTGAAKIGLRGPAGSLELPVAILAARHLHLTPTNRHTLNLDNVEEISVTIKNSQNSGSIPELTTKPNPRGGVVFSHVHLKVDPQAALELHLDTDEANAALANSGDTVEILPLS